MKIWILTGSPTRNIANADADADADADANADDGVGRPRGTLAARV